MGGVARHAAGVATAPSSSSASAAAPSSSASAAALAPARVFEGTNVTLFAVAAVRAAHAVGGNAAVWLLQYGVGWWGAGDGSGLP